MRGKRALYGVVLLTLIVSCVFSFQDTRSTPIAEVEAVPSPRATTKRVVLEQRAIVEDLQRTADALEKDVDAIHEEFCP